MEPDPQPTIGNPKISNHHSGVKENYPHTFKSPLPVPTTLDLSRFWRLRRPMDLASADDRSQLRGWIEQSIRYSHDWLGVLARRQEHDPLDPALFDALHNEAQQLLAYKCECLNLLIAVSPRAVQPQSLAQERYEAAWRVKESLR